MNDKYILEISASQSRPGVAPARVQGKGYSSHGHEIDQMTYN